MLVIHHIFESLIVYGIENFHKIIVFIQRYVFVAELQLKMSSAELQMSLRSSSRS